MKIRRRALIGVVCPLASHVSTALMAMCSAVAEAMVSQAENWKRVQTIGKFLSLQRDILVSQHFPSMLTEAQDLEAAEGS